MAKILTQLLFLFFFEFAIKWIFLFLKISVDVLKSVKVMGLLN